MPAELESKVQEWLDWDQNCETRAHILKLKECQEAEELRKLLLSRLEFGTAGLRGRMGAGYSQMNDLVIIQTAQGLCTYVEETFSDVKERGIIIGYDGRYHSIRFAELSAGIFLNRGIPVYLYSELCPTPFVPYGLWKNRCVCGIMVTASHNPKEDNGYKVYWANGAQIIGPHDKNIQKAILQNLTPWALSWDISILESSPLLKDPLADTCQAYYEIIQRDTLFPDVNQSSCLKFTYTPLHGVGYPFMVRAFDAAKLQPFIVVAEQRYPDPEFPTVKFPNPEEGRSALDLSIKTADAQGSTVIIANDPDADRVAVAEKMDNGEWHVFTGNETGALLGWWIFFCHMQKFPKADKSNLCMMASAVSSKILKTMASVEGFVFTETLTGFKWMGNKAYEYVQQGKEVLFAFEEAIGFMCGTAVLDKDGISAGVRIAEMAAYLKQNNRTLKNKLEEIYKIYGLHITSNSYYFCHNPCTTRKIFDRLRTFQGSPKTYPDGLVNGKYKIVSVRDLTNGYDSSQPDSKAILPTSSTSQMVTFTFSNGLVATLRTSGTEPKIKYYTELCASPDLQDSVVVRQTLDEMVNALIEEFLQPEENSLIPRSV